MFVPAMRSIWWLPTFGFFLFAAIELWMFAGPDRVLGDDGSARHLRTAEFILETGQVPRTDPLSFTHAGEPWIDFEWAWETTEGELYRLGGLALVCAFSFSLFGATILGIYRTLLQAGFGLGTVLLYTALAFCTLLVHFQARPLLFTYLFLALVVEVWNSRAVPLKRDWICLPIVFTAWANLHGGWLAALVYFVLSLAGRLADRIARRRGGDEAPIIPWLGLAGACLLATWINPYGWALHRAVIYLATSLKSASLWVEYLPPNFGVPTLASISMSGVTVLFILGVIFAARVQERAPRWSWEVAVPLLFFLYAGLKAQRHVLLLVEIAAVPVGRDLDVLFTTRRLPFIRRIFRNFQARQRLAGGDAWLALVTALFFSWLLLRTPITHDLHVGGLKPAALQFLREHPDRWHRPLTTTWNAGPLLWNLRPGFRVSLDDRGDFYGDKTVYAFTDFGNGVPGWQDTLKKGNYDSLLLDPYLPLNQLLHLTPGWHEVWRDSQLVVYWPDDKPASNP
jgi:hypothetical protein